VTVGPLVLEIPRPTVGPLVTAFQLRNVVKSILNTKLHNKPSTRRADHTFRRRFWFRNKFT